MSEWAVPSLLPNDECSVWCYGQRAPAIPSTFRHPAHLIGVQRPLR